MTRKLSVLICSVALVALVAAPASATMINVDAPTWQMTMSYESAAGDPGVPTVDYNMNGTAHNNVALSAYTNTQTGGLDALHAADGGGSIGWTTGGPHTGQVSWEFQALGGAGTFTAFTFDPATLIAYNADSYVRWYVSVNGGSLTLIKDYTGYGNGTPAVGTQNLMDATKSYYIGSSANTVELVVQQNSVSADPWWGDISCRVAVASTTPGLTVNASTVPEPSTLALLATGLLGLLAYAWRKRK